MTITTPPWRRTRPAAAPALAFPQFDELLPGEASGWFVEVEVEGMAWQLSKLDGEAEWTIDAAYDYAGRPMWSNGFGARDLRTKTLRWDLGERINDIIRA